MASQEETVLIPQSPAKWIIGNMQDVDSTKIFSSFWQLAEIYGPIFRFDLAGWKVIIVEWETRVLSKDGLYTAYRGEHMLGSVIGIASQMLFRWDQLGPGYEILCSDDFTRLASDMIALCAFGFYFDNFYSEQAHPFVNQMTEVLTESGRRSNGLL
ncbi:hypothetical protein K469DRAFT_688004 [Zopfia rhizophila CBS 207.26]|uniref:Uncharacterized protein n=1 Tax=Zopfia rhizophila CBS 207.26 TaxID=1314779 RepID=A0A6A6DZR8_9PEZI|nr:hypothetical protein K469DRAFT_688004 [Zopfia rhizophila CBS 207.26]